MMENRKSKNWGAGSTWGDNYKFPYAGTSGTSNLSLQTIALAEKARAINDKALLQQQLAVERMSQQNLLQHGAMPSQMGFLQQGVMSNQIDMLPQGTISNPQSLLPQGAISNELGVLRPVFLPQGPVSNQLDLLQKGSVSGAAGLLGPMPSTMMNSSSLSLLQQQQLQQQQLQQRQLQQQQIQRQQQMLEMQQLQLLHQQKLLASQDAARLQPNTGMGLGNLQAIQHQNLLQSQMSSSTENSSNLSSMTDGVQTYGQPKKKKSRFHDSNKVLLPSLDVANVGDKNSGSGYPEPSVLQTIAQTKLDRQAGNKGVNPLPIGGNAMFSQQQARLSQSGQVVAATQMQFSTSTDMNISTASQMYVAQGPQRLLVPQMDMIPAAQVQMSTASQVQMSSSQLGMSGSVHQRSLSSIAQSSSTRISTAGIQRRKSRFDSVDKGAFTLSKHTASHYHSPDNYSGPKTEDSEPSVEAEYQPEDPTDVDDDYIDDFVEKLMSGSKPKIIQPDDNKKRKGITIKDMSIPKKKTNFCHVPGNESRYRDKSDLQTKEKNSKRNHDRYDDEERSPSYETEQPRDYFERQDRTQREEIRSLRDEQSQDRYSREIHEYYHGIGTDRNRDHFDRHERQKSNEDFDTDRTNRYYSREKRPDECYTEWGELDISDQRTREQNVETSDNQTYSSYRNEMEPTFSENRSQANKTSGFRDSGVQEEDDITAVPAREVYHGHDIPVSTAMFIKSKGKYKPGLEAMTKNFKLPVNCIGLTPPKMKAEVWEILKKKTQTGDDILQGMQRWFATGVIPLILQVDHIGKALQDRQTVYRYTTDSLDALTYVLSTLSIRRRLLLRTALPNTLAILCRRTAPMTASLLFGDALPKDLLEVTMGRFKVPASEKATLDVNNDDPLGDNFKPMFFPNLAIPGPQVDYSVANIINMACANDGDMSDLRNRYHIPRNCEPLTPPKINHELLGKIAVVGLELDNRLQDVHLSIAEGMLPMMILLQSLHENKYDENQAITLLTDALLLLGNAAYQINNVRMQAMRGSLPEQIRHFCGYVWPGADTVSVDTSDDDSQC